MSAFKNIGLKGYFERYGIKNALKRGIFTGLPIHLVNDYENRKILYYNKVYKWLCRKYMSSASIDPEGLKYSGATMTNPIWVYWKQGIENAPDIVKKCILSITKSTKQPVIILNDNNISEYVIFPEYIIKKLETGNISAAAFSDLLRFSLLEHYGGTWIDATVFISSKLPDYVIESEFFAYRDSFGLIENATEMSVWILHSIPHNAIIRESRNILFEYWKRENHIVEYLLPYMVLTMILKNKYPNEYKNMPYATSEYSYLLFRSFDEPFNEKKYKHICSLTSIHKLSYKIEDRLYNKKGTFYKYIIEN